MRLFFSVVVFIIFSSSGFSQIMGDGEVYLTMERKDPTFRGGGMKEFYHYINSEFDYSKVAAKGKMITSFTVNEEGDIKNIKVIQFLDVESATEIIRVLKKAPKWEPAKRNGKPISVDIKLPLNFTSNAKKAVDESAIALEAPTNPKSESTNNTSENGATGNETKPRYPGGLNEFYKFIGASMKVPVDKDFKGGKLIVSFVVEKDGSLVDFKTVKDLGFGTAEEAIRVLKTCKNWIPATQNGIPVRCQYQLPISLQSK